MPRPAPPPRRAPPRPDRPVVCPGFGFDKSQLLNLSCLCRPEYGAFHSAPKIRITYSRAVKSRGYHNTPAKSNAIPFFSSIHGGGLPNMKAGQVANPHMISFIHHLSNPKPGHTTGRSGRGGARRGGEGERGWVGREGVGSIWKGDNPPSCLPANRRRCPGRLFGSTNKRNPM